MVYGEMRSATYGPKSSQGGLSGQEDSVHPSGHSGVEGTSAETARGAEPGQRGPWCPAPELFCTLAASMAPQRRSDFSQLVLRALCTGACVSLLNACVAGESLLSPGFAAGPRKSQGWLVGKGALLTTAFPAQGSSMCPGAPRSTAQRS